MMDALVHYPWWGAKPEGIWWFDGSNVLGSYYPDNPMLAIVGGHALRHCRYRADEFDMIEVFGRFAERQPRPDFWETVKVTGIDAKGYLDLARAVGPKAA